jgi:hypothetical protein
VGVLSDVNSNRLVGMGPDRLEQHSAQIIHIKTAVQAPIQKLTQQCWRYSWLTN